MTRDAHATRRLLLAAPLLVLRYHARWLTLAVVAARGGDVAARARRWAGTDRERRASADGDVMARLDFWALHHLMRWRRGRTLAFLLLLPVHAIRGSFRAASTLGRDVHRKHGISIVAQALDIWSLQLRLPLTFGRIPRLYYTSEIHDPARRADAAFVLSPTHQNVLTRAVNKVTSFMDKREFAQLCSDAGLPHIPTIVELGTDGSTHWSRGGRGLPETSLFSKPAGAANGAGAARWTREPDGRYRSEAGTLLDSAAVLAQLQAAAVRGAVILQPLLRNHARIEAICGSTLATVRLASMLLPDGTFEPVLAIHRSAADDSAVDNAAQGGVACPIDLATGTLGAALIRTPSGILRAGSHPGTGTEVVGVRLPEWPATLDLAARAHRAFHVWPVVGWDIAITDDGPVLVEANVIWNATSLQAAHGIALGRTRYARYLLELLDGAVAAARAPDRVRT